MKRRAFIKHTSHAIGISALLGTTGFTTLARSLAKKAAENKKVLVLIYLQGGNDGLNTLIPLDQMSALNKVRPHVVIPESDLLKLAGTDLALHPSLPGFKGLFEEERLRIVQSVGYPEQNFSHFRSTDIWMSGSGANELLTSGWTGRYLTNQFPGYPEDYPSPINPDPLAIEIGYGSTMLFQGPEAAMSMVIKDPTDFYGLVDNFEDELPDTKAADKLRHIRLTARQSQLYGEVVKNAASKINQQKPYPQTELAEQLKIVSRLIAGGLQTPMYLVKIDGFDTHDNQVTVTDHTKGEHADLLKELNDSVMAFMADLEFHKVDDKVLGMTFSEFGRRIVSNASFGTDHGAAAPVFVFGNDLVPGVLGENPVISSASTYKDNLEWKYDFRQIYASVLEQWFELEQMDRSEVLLDDFETVPVIKSGFAVGVHDSVLENQFNVYPNPIQDKATIQFYSINEKMTISVFDNNGKLMEQIFAGTVNPGIHHFSWKTSQLAAGNYLVVFRSKSVRKAIQVVK